jgi:hypothetical protein
MSQIQSPQSNWIREETKVTYSFEPIERLITLVFRNLLVKFKPWIQHCGRYRVQRKIVPELVQDLFQISGNHMKLLIFGLRI